MSSLSHRIEGPLDLERLLRRSETKKNSSVLALGTFDGVHLGHRAIIERALNVKSRLAEANPGTEIEAMGVTFDQLPLEVLRPERAPFRLMSTEARCEHLLKAGLDRVVMARFDKRLAELEPESYVRDVLIGAFGAKAIVVGFNHNFGRGGKGNVDLLRRIAEGSGAEVQIVGEVQDNGEAVSSTLIRTLLSQGKCERASRLLSRPFFLEGRVVSGFQKGRELGYPTANLEPNDRLLIPGAGVYLTRVNQGSVLLGYALTVISDRPTMGSGGPWSVESHILDFSGDLYGTLIRVEFLQFLRPIVRFSELSALQAQMAEDVREARSRILAL